MTTVELQSRLKILGYFPASVRTTGYYGSITEESVRKFQSAYGLPVNGIAELSTVTQLKQVTQQATSASRGGTMRRMPETRLSAPRTPAPQQRSGVLRPGDVGLAVLEAKRRLNQYGYTAGPGNLYDTQMVIAVKRFQEDKGLEADGLVGNQTEQLLYAAERGLPSLREGDRGNLVQLVQHQLNLVPTGEFDAVTAATVKAFQQERGLEATGVVDTQTHKTLATHLARLSLVAR
jgi:peptidoglycan hydrolase-like protein with peptidoglycan-binding domain